MSILFEPHKIGNFNIKNRFIRSATYYALSDIDGFISDRSIELKKNLAANEIGLIITGAAFVHKNGQGGPDLNGIQTDAHIPLYQKMTRAVHDLDGRIVMQIAHHGALAFTPFFSVEDYMAVSFVDFFNNLKRKPRTMTEEDIEGIIQAFGQAARRVEASGFDGVQIHGAHGYLISQFLSPVFNKRDDKWGGCLENRMRFLVEVIRAVKKNVSEDFPVMIKLGCRDYLTGDDGLTIEEGMEIATAVEKEGICHLEVSNGFFDDTDFKFNSGIGKPEQEAYYRKDCVLIRKATKIPLSLVGGMRSLPVMEEVVESGICECISISRPLIREPDLIKRWKNRDTRPATCISCGRCLWNPDSNGKNRVFCRQLKK